MAMSSAVHHCTVCGVPVCLWVQEPHSQHDHCMNHCLLTTNIESQKNLATSEKRRGDQQAILDEDI